VGQFRAIGLSGTEAVGALPRSELLGKGGDQLLPYVFGGAAVILVAAVLWAIVGRHRLKQWVWGLAVLLVAAGLTLQILLARDTGAAQWPSAAVVAIGAGGLCLIAATAPVSSLNERGERSAQAAASMQRDVLSRVALMIGSTALIFGLAVGYPHALRQKRARAAAVRLRQGRVITGAWIGATSNWIYIGKIDWHTPTRPAQTLSISRADVASFAFGKLKALPAARRELACVKADVQEVAPLTNGAASSNSPPEC
jgi:hypothetical protein